MPKITDKSFVYVPSFATDIDKRFRRIIREQEAERKAAAERESIAKASKVQPIKGRK